MKKALIIMVIILAITFIIIYIRYIRVPDYILKTAVTRSSLPDKDYIICQREMVTGFDWVVIADNNGKKNEYCNIVGANPYDELDLNDSIILADNSYIFYVVEKRQHYSEKMQQDIIEYVVSGWDIQYPVKHGSPFDVFISPKYITQNDTAKS
jgi:hypothetical protein